MSAWAVASRCCNITVPTSTAGRIMLFYPRYSYFCHAATNTRLVNRKHKRRGKIKCVPNQWADYPKFCRTCGMYTFGYPHGRIIINTYTGETCECRKPMLMWYECTGLVAVSSVRSLCAQSAVLLNVSSAAIKLPISVLIASNWNCHFSAVPWPWKAWDDGIYKLKWTEHMTKSAPSRAKCHRWKRFQHFDPHMLFWCWIPISPLWASPMPPSALWWGWDLVLIESPAQFIIDNLAQRMKIYKQIQI